MRSGRLAGSMVHARHRWQPTCSSRRCPAAQPQRQACHHEIRNHSPSQAAQPRLTEGGRERVMKRVTLGRTSMDRKRTRAAEEKRPIWAAWRRMSGMSPMVLYHSCVAGAGVDKRCG